MKKLIKGSWRDFVRIPRKCFVVSALDANLKLSSSWLLYLNGLLTFKHHLAHNHHKVSFLLQGEKLYEDRLVQNLIINDKEKLELLKYWMKGWQGKYCSIKIP